MKHYRVKNTVFRSSVAVIGLLFLAFIALYNPACHSVEEVSLQLQWVTQTQFAGYYVALDKGWYHEEGIDLTIMPGGPDQSPIDMVASGESDFGTIFLADLCVAVQKGKPVISIAQIQQNSGLLLIAKKSTDIVQPKDFINRRIGVWLGSWEAQFDALMVNEGIDLSDIEVVSQGATMEPFLRGEVDVASAMIYNEYHTVLESGIKPDELNIIDYADYGLGFPGDTLFTNQQTLKQRPELCVRMIRASLRGWQYAIEHQDEAVDIVLKYDSSGMQNRSHQVMMMDEIAKLAQMPGRDMGYTDRTTVRQVIYVLRQSLLEEPLQPEDVYTNEFWDQAQNSYKVAQE